MSDGISLTELLRLTVWANHFDRIRTHAAADIA